MTTIEELDVDIQPRRTKIEDADLDMTPMIDITFLLLAFFVVVSKMDAQVPVTLPKAISGSTIAEENCVVFVVTADAPGGLAKIFMGQSLDGASQVTSEGALDIEAEITEYVEKEISNRPTVEAILIKGSGDVRAGDIDTIKRGVAVSELALKRQLYFAVEEE
jgi:biopolymer transport protein ExbD